MRIVLVVHLALLSLLSSFGWGFLVPLPQAAPTPTRNTKTNSCFGWKNNQRLLGRRFHRLITDAAESGDWRRVKGYLETGESIERMDGDRNSPLILASWKGHLETVDFLLKRGARTDHTNQAGMTPLHFACHGGHTKVVNSLLQAGADIEARTRGVYYCFPDMESYANSPLHIAAFRGHLELCKLLVERGADVTAANSNGDTAVSLATSMGHDELVKLLLANKSSLPESKVNRQIPMSEPSKPATQPSLAKQSGATMGENASTTGYNYSYNYNWETGNSAKTETDLAKSVARLTQTIDQGFQRQQQDVKDLKTKMDLLEIKLETLITMFRREYP